MLIFNNIKYIHVPYNVVPPPKPASLNVTYCLNEVSFFLLCFYIHSMILPWDRVLKGRWSRSCSVILLIPAVICNIICSITDCFRSIIYIILCRVAWRRDKKNSSIKIKIYWRQQRFCADERIRAFCTHNNIKRVVQCSKALNSFGNHDWTLAHGRLRLFYWHLFGKYCDRNSRHGVNKQGDEAVAIADEAQT